jgi:hypothetical protein
MHHPRTPWPVATRVSYIVSFEELRKQHPRLSARRFCEARRCPTPPSPAGGLPGGVTTAVAVTRHPILVRSSLRDLS